MKKTNSIFDRANALVISITFVLFTIALFVKGITHDLLLEAGIFLVSVKLILASYQSKRISEKILAKLEAIEKEIGKE